MTAVDAAPAPARVPLAPLQSLDSLWFQVAGTLCNLQCSHCFISCSPTNKSFGLLDLETVRRYLAQSVELGVREYYFTGGEPFLNREIVEILEAALECGPTTVLTNAILLDRQDRLPRLRAAAERSPYSLEFRVSLDGPTPETNDPIRGEGTFAKTMRGVELLSEHGFLPILTCTRVWNLADEQEVLDDFRRVLREIGCERPRIKVLPSLKMGAEEDRTHGYSEADVLTPEMLEHFDMSTLVCSTSRIVTDRGVWVCPILIEEPSGHLGDDLASARGAFPLTHGACTTCYAYGSICTNAATARGTE